MSSSRTTRRRLQGFRELFSKRRRLNGDDQDDKVSERDENNTEAEVASFQEPDRQLDQPDTLVLEGEPCGHSHEANVTDVSEQDGVKESSNEPKVREMYRRFLGVVLQHKMSKEAAGAMWSYLRDTAKEAATVDHDEFKTERTRRKDIYNSRSLPTVLFDIHLTDKDTGAKKSLIGIASLPASLIYENYNEAYCLAYVGLKSVVQMHEELHDGHRPTDIILSCDAVPETKSSSRSLDVVAAQFPPCLSIYVLQIFRQGSVRKISIQEQLQRIVNEIIELKLTVKYIGADAPKRATLRGTASHSGMYQNRSNIALFTYDSHFYHRILLL
jgi:hypothetical protein